MCKGGFLMIDNNIMYIIIFLMTTHMIVISIFDKHSVMFNTFKTEYNDCIFI